jgi:hypothetical protein
MFAEKLPLRTIFLTALQRIDGKYGLEWLLSDSSSRSNGDRADSGSVPKLA